MQNPSTHDAHCSCTLTRASLAKTGCQLCCSVLAFGSSHRVGPWRAVPVIPAANPVLSGSRHGRTASVGRQPLLHVLFNVLHCDTSLTLTLPDTLASKGQSKGVLQRAICCTSTVSVVADPCNSPTYPWTAWATSCDGYMCCSETSQKACLRVMGCHDLIKPSSAADLASACTNSVCMLAKADASP